MSTTVSRTQFRVTLHAQSLTCYTEAWWYVQGNRNMCVSCSNTKYIVLLGGNLAICLKCVQFLWRSVENSISNHRDCCYKWKLKMLSWNSVQFLKIVFFSYKQEQFLRHGLAYLNPHRHHKLHLISILQFQQSSFGPQGPFCIPRPNLRIVEKVLGWVRLQGIGQDLRAN
jgi:hypothetical protein